MKDNISKVVSKVVLSVAKGSADALCDWIFYQAEVPAQLTAEDAE